MNLQALAADIASRVPAMAQECQENRYTLILGLLEAEALRTSEIFQNANVYATRLCTEGKTIIKGNLT